ncbi:MAG: CinA family protein [Gammaproteobacteria bacterium]|nr:CinA family protein [Gammaproteobacteria bacterium]
MPDLAGPALVLAELLKAHHETLAVAESSTGGLISASLLAVPGASAYYLGGTVIYTIKARNELLGLSKETLKAQSPLTEAYVTLCARAIREKLGATWGIAELGATGPAGTSYGHPPGICVLAVEGPVTLTARIDNGCGDREANMWEFAHTALQLLQRALQSRASL